MCKVKEVYWSVCGHITQRLKSHCHALRDEHSNNDYQAPCDGQNHFCHTPSPRRIIYEDTVVMPAGRACNYCMRGIPLAAWVRHINDPPIIPIRELFRGWVSSTPVVCYVKVFGFCLPWPWVRFLTLLFWPLSWLFAGFAWRLVCSCLLVMLLSGYIYASRIFIVYDRSLAGKSLR